MARRLWPALAGIRASACAKPKQRPLRPASFLEEGLNPAEEPRAEKQAVAEKTEEDAETFERLAREWH